MNGHDPVLLDEVLEGLAPATGEHLLDLTLGRGGHARRILEETAPDGRLTGVDRDPQAHAWSADELPGDRIELIHGNFGDLPDLRQRIGSGTWDLVLADLGVSSPQIDEGDRGFSFRFDGPLDMRMDPTRGETAAQLVATSTEEQLLNLIGQLGEDRHARKIAAAIVRARAVEPITTTARLASVIPRCRSRLQRKPPRCGHPDLSGVADLRQWRAGGIAAPARSHRQLALSSRSAGDHLLPLARGSKGEGAISHPGPGRGPSVADHLVQFGPRIRRSGAIPEADPPGCESSRGWEVQHDSDEGSAGGGLCAGAGI